MSESDLIVLGLIIVMIFIVAIVHENRIHRLEEKVKEFRKESSK